MKTLLIILIALVLIGCKPEKPKHRMSDLPTSELTDSINVYVWYGPEHGWVGGLMTTDSSATITALGRDNIALGIDKRIKGGDTILNHVKHKDLSGDGNIMIGWPIPEEMGGGVIQSRYINDSTIIHTNRSNGKIMVTDKYGKLRKEKL